MKIPFLKQHFYYLADAKGDIAEHILDCWPETSDGDRLISSYRKRYDDYETVSIVDRETKGDRGSLTFLYIGKFRTEDEAQNALNEIREVVKPDVSTT
jgi:hypothetical protein